MADRKDGLDRGKRRLIGSAAAALVLGLLLACSRGTARAGQRSGDGEQANGARNAATNEAEERKGLSEARLRDEGVPVNPSLPLIETAAEAKLRSAQAVADRLLALTLVAVKSDALLSGDSPASVRKTIETAVRERKAAGLFTPAERGFVAELRPDRQQLVQFIWRYEAAWVLAWALRLIDGPLDPRKGADVPRLSAIVHDEQELARRGLRPAAEILDAADLVYRYHWATREALLRGRELPKGLTEDVVTEWHHALNWLVGYLDQEWDEVTTDT